jgi:hypothetical protein
VAVRSISDRQLRWSAMRRADGAVCRPALFVRASCLRSVAHDEALSPRFRR